MFVRVHDDCISCAPTVVLNMQKVKCNISPEHYIMLHGLAYYYFQLPTYTAVGFFVQLDDGVVFFSQRARGRRINQPRSRGYDIIRSKINEKRSCSLNETRLMHVLRTSTNKKRDDFFFTIRSCSDLRATNRIHNTNITKPH